MKKIFLLVYTLLVLNVPDAASQEYTLDTIRISFNNDSCVLSFPFFQNKEKDIEERNNDLINQSIISYLSLNDPTKTTVSDLTADDVEWLLYSDFNILYFKNGLVSLDFIFQGKGQPIPGSFIITRPRMPESFELSRYIRFNTEKKSVCGNQ